jgi:hypothetical protein
MAKALAAAAAATGSGGAPTSIYADSSSGELAPIAPASGLPPAACLELPPPAAPIALAPTAHHSAGDSGHALAGLLVLAGVQTPSGAATPRRAASGRTEAAAADPAAPLRNLHTALEQCCNALLAGCTGGDGKADVMAGLSALAPMPAPAPGAPQQLAAAVRLHLSRLHALADCAIYSAAEEERE